MTHRILAQRRRLIIESRPEHRTTRVVVADRRRHESELDHAFLRWIESRLANSGPEPPEDVVLDYLVAWALGEPSAH
jgi:hypothetical protein